MRIAALAVIVAVLSLPGMGSPAAVAAGSDSSGFDGSWDVIAVCPSNVNGTFSYTLQFVADVKAGVLHGLYGTEGKPASMTLDGTIQSDGSARFAAKGLTGDAVFAGGVKPATPYGYDVTATFKGSRGTGTRIGPGRTCNYSFQRR
jgi:hypothetical protein